MEAAAATAPLTRSVSLSARPRRSRTTAGLTPCPGHHLSVSLQEKAPPAGLLPHGAGGMNDGNGPGGHGGGRGNNGGMGEHYRRVLRADPENPLLLRNYGRYLHEVEGDLGAAEACYARALLACPADADLLSLYARLIWEARREKDRAADYFQRAVRAAPEDCYALGSYASFLWDAADDDGDGDGAPDVKEIIEDHQRHRRVFPSTCSSA